MPQSGLVLSRAVVRRDYAILPPEGVAPSVLPEWRETVAKVLAAPAMGARFAQYLLELAPGGGSRQTLPGPIEAFFYLLDGRIELEASGARQVLEPGGFAYLAPGGSFQVKAASASRLLWLKKRYRPWGDARPRDRMGRESEVPAETYQGIDGLVLKTLMPAEPAYDLAMNIFTFPPGYSLPVTETHVMEHGLYFLQGQGLYYLSDRWAEVKAGDFIWMGPYVPQSFFATGSSPSRYLYYKDVHRDVEL
jgi:(S)-ureidoglycine aminohydrolase